MSLELLVLRTQLHDIFKEAARVSAFRKLGFGITRLEG